MPLYKSGKEDAMRVEYRISDLPGSLYGNMEVIKNSKLVREILGEYVFEKLIENKKIKWDKFKAHVSRYEVETHLPM